MEGQFTDDNVLEAVRDVVQQIVGGGVDNNGDDDDSGATSAFRAKTNTAIPTQKGKKRARGVFDDDVDDSDNSMNENTVNMVKTGIKKEMPTESRDYEVIIDVLTGTPDSIFPYRRDIKELQDDDPVFLGFGFVKLSQVKVIMSWQPLTFVSNDTLFSIIRKISIPEVNSQALLNSYKVNNIFSNDREELKKLQEICPKSYSINSKNDLIPLICAALRYSISVMCYYMKQIPVRMSIDQFAGKLLAVRDNGNPLHITESVEVFNAFNDIRDYLINDASLRSNISEDVIMDWVVNDPKIEDLHLHCLTRDSYYSKLIKGSAVNISMKLVWVPDDEDEHSRLDKVRTGCVPK